MAESLQDTLASFGNIMFSKFVFYSIRLVWKIHGTMQDVCNATLSFFEIHKAAGKILCFAQLKSCLWINILDFQIHRIQSAQEEPVIMLG